MKTKKEIETFGGMVAMLLLLAAFADLQISQILYNPDSIFGKMFEAIGEFPAAFIGTFCAMAMALVLKKRNQEKLNLKSAGCFLLSALMALMAGAVLGLKLFLLVVVLFNLFKLGWGRERFRHMVAVNDFSGFTAWYLPQGLASGNEFMSFPSGHSANASVLIWLTLLPNFVPAFKGKEKKIRIYCFIWMVCVMVSRVIMGAHFMSDVIAGMSLTMVVFYNLYRKQYGEKDE